KRNQKENNLLRSFFKNFFFVPGLLCQFTLLTGIAFNPVFYFTKNHFHKNGLRAYPTAKNPTIYNREKNNKHKQRKHCQHKQKEILRQKNDSENDKLALQHIEHHNRIAIDVNERR